MGKKSRKNNKQQTYFKGDMDCHNCKFYQGVKRGCKLEKCRYDEEKLKAIAKSRIKRGHGIGKWDM